MNWENFNKWFNRDFWRAFKKLSVPVKTPKNKTDRNAKVQEVFESIKSGNYAPSIPETEIVINKGFGVARVVPVFCIEDYIVYYFCVKELENIISGNRIANTFGGWSLGGQIRKLENTDVEIDADFSTSRYSFDPRAWQKAFGEFNSLLFAQLKTGSYTHVLQFDLSNFYDCVRLDILERWIREDSPKEKGWIIALLFYLLNQWNRKNTGLHPQSVGLPQDALSDCSRLLANYYLQKYDKFAEKTCANFRASYFRYADDQMILMNNPEQVDTIMLLLTRHLDRQGLRVNQKKVDLWTIEELMSHRCHKIQSIFSKTSDNKDPKLVRKFVDAYFAIDDSDLNKSWNSGLPLLNRLLWANLESLPRKLREKLLTQFTTEKYLLVAESSKLKRISELNSSRVKPINLEQRLLGLAKKHHHNSYHYECLEFAKHTNNAAFQALINMRIQAIQAIQVIMEDHRIIS